MERARLKEVAGNVRPLVPTVLALAIGGLTSKLLLAANRNTRTQSTRGGWVPLTPEELDDRSD